MGRNWSDVVSRYFPGRTALAAKNRYTLLSRRSENIQLLAKVGDNERFSTPSSPSDQSPEDEGLDFFDMSIETMPIDHALSTSTGPSQSVADDLDGLDYDPELMAHFTNLAAQQQAVECPSYPTPSSTLTPAEYRYPQLSDLPGYTYEDEANHPRPVEDRRVDEALQDQCLRTNSSTKELTVRVRCLSDRTETIMEGLTRLVNGLMVQGDVKDVNFSIV